MKKAIMSTLAAASIVLAAPQANMAPQQMGQGCGKMMNKSCKKMCRQKKGMKRGMRRNSPFLIKHGLPHMTKMVIRYWDDPAFGLNDAQKQKLLMVRKETMGAVQRIRPEVMALKREIVAASTSGVKADSLKSKVDKLASLKAEATMVQLKCVEKTTEVLSKDQLLFLLSHKKFNRKQRYKNRCNCRSKSNRFSR